MPRKPQSLSEKFVEFFVNGPLNEVDGVLNFGNAIYKARRGGVVAPPSPVETAGKVRAKKAKPVAGAAAGAPEPGPVGQVG
jgi:hypothetical protein